MTQETETRLEKLAKKYGYGEEMHRESVHRDFERTAATRQDVSRISTSNFSETGKEDLHKELAAIQLELIDLADEYEKLNVDFQNIAGSDRIYSLPEAVAISFFGMLGYKQKVRDVKLGAFDRKGRTIEILVNKMAEMLQDQYQAAVKGKHNAEGMQLENISHMKYLDRELIDSLRQGYNTGSDMAAAEGELSKLEQELLEIQEVLLGYETDVRSAKSQGDLEAVARLTDEMSKVLDIKHGVLDGKLAAEGIVSDIRRDMLRYAEGVQSAKGAAAASKVNYLAISQLIDSMSELEIKYDFAIRHMMPVFQMQAKITTAGHGALEMRSALEKVASVSNKLLEHNSRLVTILGRETFDMLRTNVYDPEKLASLEEEVRAYQTELSALKKEWAESVTSVYAPNGAHYARHE